VTVEDQEQQHGDHELELPHGRHLSAGHGVEDVRHAEANLDIDDLPRDLDRVEHQHGSEADQEADEQLLDEHARVGDDAGGQ